MKRFITFTIILAMVYAFVGTVHADIYEGLVAYYPFDGNADDESGNGNHGTVHGATLTTDRNGTPNSAYLFDGTDDLVEIEANQIFENPNISISAWVYAYSLPNLDYSIFAYQPRGASNDGRGYLLRLSPDLKILMHLGSGDGLFEACYGNSSLDVLNWYHFTATYDGNYMKVYVNGIEDNTCENNKNIIYEDKSQGNPDPKRGWIGVLMDNAGVMQRFFHGLIDDVRVFNRALNASEIQDIYNAENGSSNNVYFPHIASIDTWETEVCIINTSPQQSLSGLMQAYSDSGQPVDSKSVSLGPKARREMVVGNEFSNPGDIGYMVFSSDSQHAVGYLKFYIDGRYRVAIPAASDVNTGDIYISHIASDKDWTTGVSILNTTSSSKDLSIQFDNGTTKTRTIAANEHQAFLIRELFDGIMQSNIKSAVIKNGAGIVGLEIFGSTEVSGNSYLSGILLKDDTTTNIYYPHIASDSIWDTGIVAYNPSDTPCNLTITPYRSDGAPLSPQTRNLTGKEKYIGIIQDLNLPDGTAWFSIEASSPITGFELFSTKDGKQLGGYTGVGISSTVGVFAKIDNDGTGIAFVNIEDAPVNVTVTAYDDNGSVIATETFVLKAYEKVVEVAADLFSQDISTASYITYASSGEVVGFQLNVSSDGMMLDALPGM